MKVSIEDDCTNSCIMTIDGIQFTVMAKDGEEFTDDERAVLESLVKKVNSHNKETHHG